MPGVKCPHLRAFFNVMKASDKRTYEQVLARASKWGYAQCEECGVNQSYAGLQVHHIKLRSQGGKTVQENLKLVCGVCHGKAHGIKVVNANKT